MTKFYSKFILKNKKIIVIGGSGQLGFKTCEMLINAGARVINIDIFEKKKLETRTIFITGVISQMSWKLSHVKNK